MLYCHCTEQEKELESVCVYTTAPQRNLGGIVPSCLVWPLGFPALYFHLGHLLLFGHTVQMGSFHHLTLAS